jgi:glycosyltransferase involved in cell wall biosynthesis
VRVAFLTRYDRRRASSRVRAYQYGPHLAALGFTCRFLPWGERPRPRWPAYVVRALALARWADVVVLQKPFQPVWFVDALARLNPHLVVDVDDAVWEAPDGSHTGAVQRAAELGRRFDHAARRAGLVIVGSNHLAELVRGRCPETEVHVLPSCVEFDRFPPHRHRPGRPAVVGWIGSPENLAEIGVCEQALRRLVTAGEVTLRVVSSRPAPLSDLPAQFAPWSIEGEPVAVSGFDIGIMPLRDTARTRGRCGFKAIECMAAGVPVVASPVPGPSEVVSHGVTGYLAANDTEWEARLQELARDHELRSRMGQAGRERVASAYSAAACAPRLAALLEARTGRRNHLGAA